MSSTQNLLVPGIAVTEFAKKLHGMLEDPTFETLVCWGPKNDCFIIKDINEFSVSVLPQIFNHSNFSSLVRQLNKYDFHKSKQVDQGDKQSCLFYHQHFHRDRPHDLQHIKRKVKSTGPTEVGTDSGLVFSNQAQPSDHFHVNHTSSSTHVPSSTPAPANMNILVEDVAEDRDQLWKRLRVLETNYELMQSELGHIKDQMGQNNAIIEALGNRLGSSTQLGNVTSGPPFSTPIMIEGTRNVPSSGLNRTSTSGQNPVSHIPRLDAEARPDFHGINFPPSINTRHQDSIFASPLGSFAFGSQNISGQPTSVTLPVESRRQVGRQTSDAQSVYRFIGSSGEGTEFKGEHDLTKEYNQGELRESDGAVYRQRGDPGAGAVSGHIETVGKWSFDTSAVATRGLHGLGIAVIGPHPANASGAVLMDCDSDISPTMLQSD